MYMDVREGPKTQDRFDGLSANGTEVIYVTGETSGTVRISARFLNRSASTLTRSVMRYAT